ncbi:MAG: MFS transporter [Caldiserica bacterium]|nr:MFS transporter [Caldisericota bacterium]
MGDERNDQPGLEGTRIAGEVPETASKEILREESVPVHSRIWVSAADGGAAILCSIAEGAALTYYFTRVMGLAPRLASIVWLLFGIWNAFNDPLFGYISDRTRTKLGRRIPYIRYGAPLYAAAFAIFWIVVPGSKGNQTTLFIQMLIGMFLFDALYTAIATAVYIMPYEMAVSNKARSSIFIWKIGFSLVATAFPIAIGLIQPGPGQDATPYRLIMIGLGVLMAVVIYASTFFYKENHFQQEEEQFSFWKSLGACFRNKSFVVFESISFTVIYVQNQLMQGIYYYYDEVSMGVAKSTGTSLTLGSLFVGAILGLLLFLNRRDVWGVKRCVRVFASMFGVGCVAGLLFPHQLIPMMISFLLIGVGFAGGMYLIPLMNGDVIDADEHTTGLRREGMYAGVNSFVTKPAMSLAQAIFLGFLSHAGYDQSLAKGMQSASAEAGIVRAWFLMPAILLLACAVILRWYPLDGPNWEQIKSHLTVVHRDKERAYLAQHGLK